MKQYYLFIQNIFENLMAAKYKMASHLTLYEIDQLKDKISFQCILFRNLTFRRLDSTINSPSHYVLSFADVTFLQPCRWKEGCLNHHVLNVIIEHFKILSKLWTQFTNKYRNANRLSSISPFLATTQVG